MAKSTYPFPANTLRRPGTALAVGVMLACTSLQSSAQLTEPGLLFHLSGKQGTTADHAAPGTAAPTFDTNVSVIADGARGPALQCEDLQRLAWKAPGNIYAQRGTVSFYWRSRYPVGPTAFPIFRVAYADHSSWDMAWLRIDYNGKGFDAFVTDASLSRTRVSVDLGSAFPKPNEWTLITLAWDEATGIRLYLNGKRAAEQWGSFRYDAALDQFGPHSRIISPHQVQSDYNFTRGGDIDELRIYDRELPAASVALLARDEALPKGMAANLAEPTPAESTEWLIRHGWFAPQKPPPYYKGKTVGVRKVEIHDAYDLKRWWWKATDGIRETTWPGVYNRSRLPGRNDYFQLPDWDAYVESGKSITFALPNEPVNHIEMTGAAFGQVDLLPKDTVLNDAAGVKAEARLFTREPAHKSVHTTNTAIAGRKIRFTNVEIEQPIGEFGAYHVSARGEPAGSKKLAFKLGGGSASEAGVGALEDTIKGRYPLAERQLMIARPLAQGSTRVVASPSGLPVVQVLIPNSWDALAATDGLDGIALDLPALKVDATHEALFPLNIRVKDPLWPLRDMLDFSFSVKPGEAKTVWLDLRDRILPAGKGLWITIAAAGLDFNPAMLEGAQLRMVFKPRQQAAAEHEMDRDAQMRDSYAMLVEEHPKSPKLALWVRFEADVKDLLRVNPKHQRGVEYAAEAGVEGAVKPPVTLAAAPAGVPLWAFRQTELLGRVKKFVNYYIDQRQVPNGDFGGGISDDTDMLNMWPGVAMMGSNPDKIRDSTHALLEAAYRNNLFTNGLSTIQTDELHSYEEGINTLGQTMLLEHGSPRQLERAMETARGVLGITGINSAGHRHIRSSYFSGSTIAEEEPFGRVKPYSYLIVQPGQLLVDYNGSPAARKYMIEMTDALIAHRKPDAANRPRTPIAIRFSDDREIDTPRGYFPWAMYWGPYKWTGDQKYVAPLFDGGLGLLSAFSPNALDTLNLRKEWGSRILEGARTARVEPTQRRAQGLSGAAARHLSWQLTGDKSILEELYGAQLEATDRAMFINTEGSLWTDRVDVPTNELQRARLGGLALLRNSTYPGHVVGWRFAAPANDQSVAILVPNATPTGFKVIAYNLETTPVNATMTGWTIDPGKWEITQGIDSNNDDVADQGLATREETFERSRSLAVTLAPRSTTVLTLKLKTPGTPYWSRSDLGIDREDVVLKDGLLKVRVHSLGGKASAPASLVLRGRAGNVLGTVAIPPLAAPDDMLPKTTEVELRLPAGTATAGATVEIDAGAGVEEITAMNNVVRME